jgi:hypothetical protein
MAEAGYQICSGDQGGAVPKLVIAYKESSTAMVEQDRECSETA